MNTLIQKGALIFQFRHGAIKSELILFQNQHFVNFNSDMVRLRDGVETDPPGNITDFNSDMVRLRDSAIRALYCSLENFNSDMVRLRGLNHYLT